MLKKRIITSMLWNGTTLVKGKNFDISNSKKNLFKAKKYLSNKEIKFIEKELKKYLQWPKKIYI